MPRLPVGTERLNLINIARARRAHLDPTDADMLKAPILRAIPSGEQPSPFDLNGSELVGVDEDEVAAIGSRPGTPPLVASSATEAVMLLTPRSTEVRHHIARNETHRVDDTAQQASRPLTMFVAASISSSRESTPDGPASNGL